MSSQAAPKQTKQQGALKNRRVFVSQIDTSHLTDPNCTKSLTSSQPSTCNNAIRQNNLSPFNRGQQNVRSGRHLPAQFRTEFSQSPTKTKSTRALSTQQPNESFKENALKINLSKVEQKGKNPLLSSPTSREKTKKKKRATTAKTIEISALMHDPRIGAFDMGLSPHTKKASQGQKHEKIMNLLQSYVPPSARSKKNGYQTQSLAFASSLGLDVTGESQHLSISHYRKPSSTQDSAWENISKPVAPELVLDQYSSNLSNFEKEEIREYQEIYFMGNCQNKSANQEFDDERGDYVIVPGDHIKYQYEVIEVLGKGSFGQVIKVFDHKSKEYLALKIIRNHKKFQAQARIEIRLLEYLTTNKGVEHNIVELKQHFVFRQHVCLLFDLMSLNLYDFLKKNKFQGLSPSLLRNIATQILYSLKFLNQHKIIHCDLKPENILFKYPNKTGVQLIDFGSSCFEDEKLYTYIQSRFYRSPEIILGLNYNTQVDMWSFGCLLCELYTGCPIFAGDSEHDQLCAIMEVLGVPDSQLLTKASRKKLYFEDNCKPKLVTNSKGRTRIPASIPLSSFIPGDKKFLDFIQQCLIYDPKKRYTPDEALAHPWIQEEFPQEGKSQHIKLIDKVGEKCSAEDSLESKFVLDLRSLKEKEPACLTLQDSKQTRRSSQTKGFEDSSLNLFQIETLQREISCGSMDLSALKHTSSENKLKNKLTKKELKSNNNHNSLVINTSISLNRSGQNTLRSKANKSKDSLMSILVPHSAKENLKITSRNEALAVKESDQNKIMDKSKAPLSMKSPEKSNIGATCINLKENIIVKEKIAKENKVKDDENVIGKVNLADHKNKLSRRNWNSPKTIDIDSKSPIDLNRNGALKSPKNVICLNLKSPKLRKMV